jgi:hypothetical protein
MDAICVDARAAYDYMVKDLHWDPHKIIIFGESLGTVVAGDLSSQVDCAGIVLQCPLYSVLRRGQEILVFVSMYPSFMWPHNGFDNGAILSKKHVPLLIVGGTLDKMTPIHHADELFAAACEPKAYVRIEGGGHTGDRVLMSSPRYAAGLQKFLDGIAPTTGEVTDCRCRLTVMPS